MSSLEKEYKVTFEVEVIVYAEDEYKALNKACQKMDTPAHPQRGWRRRIHKKTELTRVISKEAK